MTTASSPLRVLRTQANMIAQAIKAAERGEMTAIDPAGKIEAARARGSFKFAVAMDDKVISIEITTAQIRDSSEVALAQLILKRMREEREH